MKIKDFITDTVTTPEEARNLFSLLIGFNLSGENTSNALLKLYDSFPEDYKKNKKLFSSVFYKFFMKYEMLPEHLSYFETFHSFWAISEQEKIRQKNKFLLIDTEVKQFKNSLEFAKALSVYNEFYSEIFDFLDKNSDNIQKLSFKNKLKFIENLHKHNCWESIIISDYEKFKDFCNTYAINYLNILKEQYVSSYYGFKYLVNKINDEHLFLILKDIASESDFFLDSSFFYENNKKNKKNQPNIFQLSLLLLKEDKVKSFSFLFNNYPNELNNCMNCYFLKDNEKPEVKESKHWIYAIDNMMENTKQKFNQEPLNEFEVRQLNNHALKDMDSCFTGNSPRLLRNNFL